MAHRKSDTLLLNEMCLLPASIHPSLPLSLLPLLCLFLSLTYGTSHLHLLMRSQKPEVEKLRSVEEVLSSLYFH